MDSGSNSESSPWKYFPFDLGECEDLEEYEPGGFHPVHLGDVYDDGRYRIVHKLGWGGFSTVWLARDSIENGWTALKIVAARDSATYEARCGTIADHPSVAASPFFATINRKFWINGPNGRHLCIAFPTLGPDLSKLSKGIYSRIDPEFAKRVSLQASRALAHLHAHGLCHGDFTASNILLRLTDDFKSYDEADLLQLFGAPRSAPVHTYSGDPPAPHAPNYIVVPLDFCPSTTNVLSDEVCIVDFDQSFETASPPSEHPGIPAKYLAPEVAVGLPQGPPSDGWALGCAIFRIRSGDDLFFNYDTNCPADALRQIVQTIGDLPEEWGETKFDENGFAVREGESGEKFWILEKTKPLAGRIRAIFDKPPSLYINDAGEALEAADVETEAAMFEDWAALREPYPSSLASKLWKPTAVCADGLYMTAYSDETDHALKAFPRIRDAEATLLLDLLRKIFMYDPAERISAEALLMHPWFHTA